MPCVYSQMPRDKYLAAMKRKFDNPLLVFDSLVMGIVFGSFFAVAIISPRNGTGRSLGSVTVPGAL